MNVSGIGLSSVYPLFDRGQISISQKEKVNDKQAETGGSAEEKYAHALISQFTEDHDPVARKVEQIMAKFMGGRELSEEEMEFLAKNVPDCYKMVREVLIERAQMEMKLEAAESKMEVAQIYSEALTMVKETKGTGEMEKKNAQKTMARVNQLQDAYGGFVGTPTYRELEDEADKAEEIREAIEETEADEKGKEAADIDIAVTIEDAHTEEDGKDQENADIQQYEEASGIHEDENQNKKIIRKSDKYLTKVVTGTQDDMRELRRKVNNLYKDAGKKGAADSLIHTIEC